jgi:hypothetical protein
VSDSLGPLADLLDAAQHVLVLHTPGVDRSEVPAIGAGAAVHALASDAELPDAVDAVVLVARDLADLRRTTAAVGGLPATTLVGCVLVAADSPPLLTCEPGWPAVAGLTARSAPQAFTLFELTSPVAAQTVLRAMARGGGSGRLDPAGWPVIGAHRQEPHRWPPNDPGALVGTDAQLGDLSAHLPPDLLTVDGPLELPPSSLETEEGHNVLGRRPVVAELGPELTWSAFEELGLEGTETRLRAAGPLSLGGLDQRLVNPTGFKRQPRRGVAQLVAHEDSNRLRVRGDGREIEIDARHGLSETDVAALRPFAAVELGWAGTAGPQAYCRVVAALAMAGVPLMSGTTPSWAAALLHPELVTALTREADLSTILGREVHSIVLRRAALRNHSTTGWRRAMAETYDVQGTPPPRVSVLLSTRRPDQLGFALRQVARQRGAEIEVVLVTHGFEADPAALAQAGGLPVTVVQVPAERSFGAALNEGAARAQGDVLLKMDDDDWYGRDFVGDLLLARDYSGADLLGCPPEFTFVEPLWLTVRRQDATEAYRPIVAGGTLMVDRGTLAALGGFRQTRRSVDAALLQSLRDAGGSVYRTHGHGYVLRRGAQGHTWDPGLGYFISRRLSWFQWRGFTPSPLLDPDPEDLPRPPTVRTS